MKMSQRKVIGAVVIAGVLIVAASVGIWAMFLDDDAPDPVSLQDAVASLSTPTAENEASGETTATEPSIAPTATESTETAATEGATATTGESSASTDAAVTEEEAGAVEAGATTTWGIASGSETFVGYRIGEELATIGTTEAVGRTSSVTGKVAINGSIVESATIEANMMDLTSDDSRRDDTLQNRGLETATYPTATFVLTQPIDLGSELTDGAIYSVVAVGDLTLHGVTQPVEIQMEAQYTGGALVIVGSLEIQLADYNITAPTTRIALAVDDHGTMEMQLILSQNG